MYKLFVTKIPKSFNKKLLYELILQFSPIKDFYYKPNGRFSIVIFNTKKDLLYTTEMLKTIRHIKVEVSGTSTIVKVTNLDPSITTDGFKMIMSKFGSVKFKKGNLHFKKEESAKRAIEECDGKFIGSRKISLIIVNEENI